jgi:transposase
MGPAFKKATDARAPQARQCVDPFHVVQLANRAIDSTRRDHWNAARRPRRARGRPRADAASTARTQSRWVKHTRWALVKDPDALNADQLDVLHHLRRDHSPLYRCWQLKEGLRDLFRLQHPDQAPRHLAWWLAWACRSRIPAFITLAATIRTNRERILAAVELGLSNSKLEGLNSKIRLINHRGYGHHSAAALIAMIYLCCGGITIAVPFR